MHLHPTSPGEPEILSADELFDITQRKSAGGQARWLSDHGWRYEVSGDRVIVGRLYCRLRLCGIEFDKMDASGSDSGWAFENVT